MAADATASLDYTTTSGLKLTTIKSVGKKIGLYFLDDASKNPRMDVL